MMHGQKNIKKYEMCMVLQLDLSSSLATHTTKHRFALIHCISQLVWNALTIFLFRLHTSWNGMLQYHNRCYCNFQISQLRTSQYSARGRYVQLVWNRKRYYMRLHPNLQSFLTKHSTKFQNLAVGL